MRRKESRIWQKWEEISYILNRYPTLEEDLTYTRKRVFEVIQDNPDDSLELLAEKLNMSSSGVANHINATYKHFYKKALFGGLN